MKKNTLRKYTAKAGLTAKGLVYCLLGLLAFMAGFNINGQSAVDADKQGVFDFVYRQAGGKVILCVIALGLICYCIWRVIQLFSKTEGDKKKQAAKKVRYVFTAVTYGFLAYSIIKQVYSSDNGSGNSREGMVAQVLSLSYGQWLVGSAALVFAIVGVYQLYYGLSEKYKKHVDETAIDDNKKALLTSGKIGYTSRGIVWLVIAWLFIKAAVNSSSESAGSTSKALSFLQDAPYGSYLLGAVAIGLICYGTFNFIRARYENFDN